MIMFPPWIHYYVPACNEDFTAQLLLFDASMSTGWIILGDLKIIPPVAYFL
jgi:hypothetical protein